MKILVALKQVPDTESKIKVADTGNTIDQTDLKWITSPNDEYALEEALRLKEARGAEIIAVSIGSEKAKDVLRNALALGADSAVLLKTDSVEDPLVVARALSAFADGKNFDLLFFGHKCYGNDNGCVGVMTAELLGLPQAHVVTKLDISDAGFRAEREGDSGLEVIEGGLPAVITAQRGLNEPRYANLKGIMAAKKKPIEEIDCALSEAAIKISALTLPAPRSEGVRLDGDPSAQAVSLAARLRDEAKVI
ncbi:MAG: electron transfer flavoprotein subunit beta/FixA family protein [Holophagales bacterium]|jgi:electron transfer flavoprotein beta subunit|nr:electron transfer flavoprotein subunit beta/FixA family protein [Holophagales bacterium]